MESNAQIHCSSGVDATSNCCSCCVVVVDCNWVALISSSTAHAVDDDDARADDDVPNLSVAADGLDPGVETGEVQGGVIGGKTVMCFDDGEVDRMTVWN